MRKQVFFIFQLLVASAFLLSTTVLVTHFVRYVVFDVLHWVTFEATPGMLVQVIQDPVFVPAMIIAALFVWSFPWERYFGDATPETTFGADGAFMGREKRN